jgi:hypothetical protein
MDMAILLHPYLPSKINRLRLETPNRMHSLLRFRGPVLLAAALAAAGCGSNSNSTTGPSTPATQLTETYEGTITIHGAITHPIVVQTAGAVVATFTALDPSTYAVGDETKDTVLGLSLGTWNGLVCTVGAPTLANDAAKAGVSLTGSATATGNYCVRVYDPGTLTQSTGYQLTVTHY